jgi:ABC-2 type transport system ATP-binding protein
MSSKQESAIIVSNVSKDFLLPHQRASTLKSKVIKPIRKKSSDQKQHALDNVSFEIKKGEFFGIVGRNGSGKSTLLKCISKIYTPDAGHVKVNGTLVPFVELGVGFNGELSGRDNVYLNGAMLGFNNSQMDAMYDDIVEFAELEEFMDQKLKNYSSGMQVRLAFSIAIRAEGDILLLDEVLAVGDSAFKQKCNDYFYDLKAKKKTIVFVSHSMSSVQEYCDRALFIDKGKVVKIGSPQEVAYLYEESNKESYLKDDLKHQDKEIKRIEKETGIKIILTKNGKLTNSFQYGDEATVSISWKDPEVQHIGVALYSKTGKYIFGANTELDEFKITKKAIDYNVKLTITDDSYQFKVAFFGESTKLRRYFIDNGPSFLLKSDDEKKWGGLVELKRKWH